MCQKYYHESFYGKTDQITATKIADAISKKEIIAGTALYWSDEEKRLYVELGNNNVGILPLEEITHENLKYKEDDIPVQAKVLLNKKICFYIDHIDSNSDIILSRRKLQLDVINSLVEGNRYLVQITAWHQTGVFVDIGCGVTGYIHYSEISINKQINYDYSNLNVGDVIPAKIISLEPKIQLSYRKALDYNIKTTGEHATATILSRLPQGDGYFAYISPNEAGIVDTDGRTTLRNGERVPVKVKSYNLVLNSEGALDKVHYKLILFGSS